MRGAESQPDIGGTHAAGSPACVSVSFKEDERLAERFGHIRVLIDVELRDAQVEQGPGQPRPIPEITRHRHRRASQALSLLQPSGAAQDFVEGRRQIHRMP